MGAQVSWRGPLDLALSSSQYAIQIFSALKEAIPGLSQPLIRQTFFRKSFMSADAIAEFTWFNLLTTLPSLFFEKLSEN